MSYSSDTCAPADNAGMDALADMLQSVPSLEKHASNAIKAAEGIFDACRVMGKGADNVPEQIKNLEHTNSAVSASVLRSKEANYAALGTQPDVTALQAQLQGFEHHDTPYMTPYAWQGAPGQAQQGWGGMGNLGNPIATGKLGAGALEGGMNAPVGQEGVAKIAQGPEMMPADAARAGLASTDMRTPKPKHGPWPTGIAAGEPLQQPGFWEGQSRHFDPARQVWQGHASRPGNNEYNIHGLTAREGLRQPDVLPQPAGGSIPQWKGEQLWENMQGRPSLELEAEVPLVDLMKEGQEGVAKIAQGPARTVGTGDLGRMAGEMGPGPGPGGYRPMTGIGAPSSRIGDGVQFGDWTEERGFPDMMPADARRHYGAPTAAPTADAQGRPLAPHSYPEQELPGNARIPGVEAGQHLQGAPGSAFSDYHFDPSLMRYHGPIMEATGGIETPDVWDQRSNIFQIERMLDYPAGQKPRYEGDWKQEFPERPPGEGGGSAYDMPLGKIGSANCSADQYEKLAGVYGGFIHAKGLDDEQYSKLQELVQQHGTARGDLTRGLIENDGYSYMAGGGGIRNWGEGVVDDWAEAYPELKDSVWPGESLMELQGPRGPRRWLGLLPGKREPMGEGYAMMLMRHANMPTDDNEYIKNFLGRTEDDFGDESMLSQDELDRLDDHFDELLASGEYDPQVSAYVDHIQDANPEVWEALKELTEGRFEPPIPREEEMAQ